MAQASPPAISNSPFPHRMLGPGRRGRLRRIARVLWCLGIILLSAAASDRASAQESGTFEQTTGVPHALHTSPVAPSAPIPAVTISADAETTKPEAVKANGPMGAKEGFSFAATGNATIEAGSEFYMRADSMSGNGATGTGSAAGRVVLRELDTRLTATQLTYNRDSALVVLEQAVLDYAPFYLSSTELTLKGDTLTAKHATLATCPPSHRPEFRITAEQMRAQVAEGKIDVHNATLYLGNTRLLSVRNYSIKAAPKTTQTNPNQGLSPTVAYDSNRGIYAVIGESFLTPRVPTNVDILIPQKGGIAASATTSSVILLDHRSSINQNPVERDSRTSSLALVRYLASEPGHAVPERDPLLYHDFLGSNPLETVFNLPVRAEITPNASVSYRTPVFGRRISELDYSALPEVGVRLDAPLSNNGMIPTNRDPVAVREALRRPYLFAFTDFRQGYYEERPTNADSWRTALLVGLDSRPILIGPNILLRPRLNLYDADYATAHTSYRYAQIDVSLQRSFSDKSAVGLEYVRTRQSGRDPFVFDSVDSAQQLTLRGQAADRHAIYSGQMKFDLDQGGIYYWQIGYSRPQRCFIPTITYQHPGGAIGLTLNIPGLTF